MVVLVVLRVVVVEVVVVVTRRCSRGGERGEGAVEGWSPAGLVASAGEEPEQEQAGSGEQNGKARSDLERMTGGASRGVYGGRRATTRHRPCRLRIRRCRRAGSSNDPDGPGGRSRISGRGRVVGGGRHEALDLLQVGWVTAASTRALPSQGLRDILDDEDVAKPRKGWHGR